MSDDTIKLRRIYAASDLATALETAGWYFARERAGADLVAPAFHVSTTGAFVPGRLAMDLSQCIATVFVWDDESAAPYDGGGPLYTVAHYHDDERDHANCDDASEVVDEIRNLIALC